MTSQEAHAILFQARKLKVFASRRLFGEDLYEVCFSQYSEARYKKYDAARLFLLSVSVEKEGKAHLPV